MPQQEFLAVQQRPDDVFPGLASIAGAAEVISHGVRARRRLGFAAERGEVELVQELGIARARVEPLADPVVAASSLRRTVGPLIIWNAWASVVDSERSHSQVSSRSGLPKVFRNATSPATPGELSRAQRARGAAEPLGHLEHLADGVEQHLGRQQSHGRVREVRLVLAVGGIGSRAAAW